MTRVGQVIQFYLFISVLGLILNSIRFIIGGVKSLLILTVVCPSTVGQHFLWNHAIFLKELSPGPSAYS